MELKDLLELIHRSIVRIFDYETEECIATLEYGYGIHIQQYERCNVEMIINNEQSIDIYISIE